MILDDIIENKILEVEQSKKDAPLDKLLADLETCPEPKDFYSALNSIEGEIRIIAEIKQASPSKGILTSDFDPVRIAGTYLEGGANAISVLTDSKFFKGSLQDLQNVRRAVDIPLLRKDFIIDPYQIYEAKFYGADAILLIVAALSPDDLQRLKTTAESLGLATLVEVHNEQELQTALGLNCRIIDINNRDLKTFNVDMQTSINLKKLIPDDILVISESGIKSPKDIQKLKSSGITTFLIGESFMKSDDPVSKLNELKNLD